MLTFKPKQREDNTVVATISGSQYYIHPKVRGYSERVYFGEEYRDINNKVLEFSSMEDCTNWCTAKNNIERI